MKEAAVIALCLFTWAASIMWLFVLPATGLFYMFGWLR